MKKEKGSSYASFPYQKRPTREKGKAFMKQCIDSAIESTIKNDDIGLRSDRWEKQVNYDLANGILHEEDMYKITNPFNIDGFDRDLQDYPLVKPRLNLLLGEEINRRFDFQVRVLNDSAISEKEDKMKEILLKELSDMVLSMHYNEEETNAKLQKLDKWKNYSYLDIRERMASQILNYLWRDLNLPEVFNMGMEDVLIASEEIYAIESFNNKLSARRVDPLNIYTVRSSINSLYIDDSDIIIEEGYDNIGNIIDDYYEDLKPEDISKLEAGMSQNGSPIKGMTLNYSLNYPTTVIDDMIDTDNITNGIYAEVSPFTEDGLVRKVKVTWRSLRKVGIITSFDEMGMKTKRFVDENYKPNKMMGEKVKWVWMTEWWEGTRIADDIYVRMGPKELQPIIKTNSRVSGSGYVGTVYSIGTTKAKSMIGLLKPYQYLYDEFMDRIKQAFAKFKGPMIELDFAKMPEGWEPEKWMHYAEKMGYLIVDSFKEGRKGAATGKIAGNFNTTNRVINPDLGSYIQQHVMMLEYIEKQIGIISGINSQRLGEIKSTETVGGVERAVTQSSHITERLFKLHDNTKLRVLETLLEYAKIVWKGDKTKLQYVLDDMTSKILEVDGDKINEADYGVFVSDSRSDMELKQSLKQLGSMMVQSGKASISTLIDIYTSPSMSSMRAKIEKSEDDAIKREEASQKAEMQAKQQEVQLKQKLEEEKLQLEERIAIMNNKTQLAIESMKINPSDDDFKALEIELKERDLEIKKQTAEAKLKIDKELGDKKIQLEQEKILEQKRANKASEVANSKNKNK